MLKNTVCDFYETVDPRGFEGWPDKAFKVMSREEMSPVEYLAMIFTQGENLIKNGKFRDKYLECAPLLYSVPQIVLDAEKRGIKIPKAEEIIHTAAVLYGLITSKETDNAYEVSRYDVDESFLNLGGFYRKLKPILVFDKNKFDSTIDDLAGHLAGIAQEDLWPLVENEPETH